MIDPDERPYGCFHCGKTLYGKSNQKYCNDYCRNKGNRDKQIKKPGTNRGWSVRSSPY